VSAFGAILTAKLRISAHQVASVRNESKLKVGVISVSALLLWLGAFVLFFYGFRALLRFGNRGGGEFVFGELLLRQSLGILSLSVFLLLIFSNVLVAFSTMYKSKEVVYLLQGPVSFREFFLARFVECVAFSSWSLGFLGSPLLLAYGISINASPWFYLAALGFFIPYVIIPACIGSVITLVLVRVFPRLKVPVLVLLGIGTVAGFFLYIRRIIESTRIAEDTPITAFFAALERSQSAFLPSYWAAEGVLRAGKVELGAALYFFALLVANAAFALWISAELAQRLFYPGWAYLNGQDKQRIKSPDRGPLNAFLRLLRWIPQPQGALVMKDIKLFWRDPTQWSQFVIFFGIMAIYMANLRNSSRYYEEEVWRSWIACLNVGSVTLILATLTSRFVFPLVSLEGRRFWILGLAPLSFRQLVWQKFWLSVATTSFFTVGLALLSGYMLQLDPVYYALTVYSVVITNFGLAGLAVGLGTLYPTFTEDNPARIVSGMGGTLNLLVSIGYITLVVAAQTLILQWRVLERFTSPEMFWVALAAAVAFITALSLACTFVPMRLGLRNLEGREF
jgi:ABC-2 type transport system permease protein